MLMDARNLDLDEAHRYGIIDMATGQELYGPILWADDEAGVYCQYLLDEEGHIQMNDDRDDFLTMTHHAPIMIFERHAQIRSVLEINTTQVVNLATMKGQG